MLMDYPYIKLERMKRNSNLIRLVIIKIYNYVSAPLDLFFTPAPLDLQSCGKQIKLLTFNISAPLDLFFSK
jgi:hypothetical protein